MVLCYLNSLCGFFIAYLFHEGLPSLSIVAVRRRWDSAQKAQACKHAGVYYLILAVALTLRVYCCNDDEGELSEDERAHRASRREHQACLAQLLATDPSRSARREAQAAHLPEAEPLLQSSRPVKASVSPRGGDAAHLSNSAPGRVSRDERANTKSDAAVPRAGAVSGVAAGGTNVSEVEQHAQTSDHPNMPGTRHRHYGSAQPQP